MFDSSFPIRRIDHIELYVGSGRQVAEFFQRAFGFHLTAWRGLETGSREVASYLLEQGDIRLVVTTALTPESPVARHVWEHGDGVAVIALEVPAVDVALERAVAGGAEVASDAEEAPIAGGTWRSATIHAFGDTRLRFVERRASGGAGVSGSWGFAPGFEPRASLSTYAPPGGSGGDCGLTAIDHLVANVERGAMDRWVRFLGATLGFTELMHFDDRAISTEYSALMSKVMQDGTGRIKIPINEPAAGRRKSQVEEYLDFYRGPGVQHIALETADIIRTVGALRDRGVAFLQPPATYYHDLSARVGRLGEPMEALADLGILVDRDDEGYLLQIFTEPVPDRPTLFFEIIQRHGARGFGEGNFRALFEAIEREQELRGNF